MKIRIGVLGTAAIARRKMIPAILGSTNFEYAGVAIASFAEREENISEAEKIELWDEKCKKAYSFQEEFGGKFYDSFDSLLNCTDIDAVYIPLPPALHFKWASRALCHGKHVLMEKPFTCSELDTKALLKLAKEKNLAVWENYAFVYHEQVKCIRKAMDEIGEIRLLRATFGFPHRAMNDFRYCNSAGGGALLDCGGYTVKAAALFMGNNIELESSHLITTDGHEVDIYGNATMTDENGVTAQLAFGMDNAYVCELQIWGSKGMITAPRFFTAPADMDVSVMVKIGNEEKIYYAKADQFMNSLNEFACEIAKAADMRCCYNQVNQQAELIEKFVR